MRLRVAVIGSSGPVSPAVADMAYRVGYSVAAGGAILLCGGRDGIMDAVCKGAKAAGGITVGILPGTDIGESNAHIDIPITTGLAFDWRSLILVHSADAVIAIEGGNGTLLEVSTAYHNGKPIVALVPSGGWAARLQQAAYDGRYLDYRRTVAVTYADQPEEAASLALDLARRLVNGPESAPAGDQ